MAHSTEHAVPVEIDDQSMEQLIEALTKRDQLGFSSLISQIVDTAVQEALEQQSASGYSGNIPVDLSPFRAKKRWEPSTTDLQRGRVLMLEEFRKPHNLPVVKFAELAGKSRQQIYKDVEMKRLLALSIGARGQRIPDWQLDPIKKQLTQSLMDKARDVDEWSLYYALSEPNQGFSGKAPVETVTARNIERVLSALLSQLGIND